jgi:hypothetical protein
MLIISSFINLEYFPSRSSSRDHARAIEEAGCCGKCYHWAQYDAFAQRSDLAPIAHKQGQVLDVTDEEGKSLLHIAAANGRVKVVQYLLLQGVNINAVDNKGNTVSTPPINLNNSSIRQCN